MEWYFGIPFCIRNFPHFIVKQIISITIDNYILPPAPYLLCCQGRFYPLIQRVSLRLHGLLQANCYFQVAGNLTHCTTHLFEPFRFLSKLSDIAQESIFFFINPDWAEASFNFSMIFSHTRGTPMWDVGCTSFSVLIKLPYYNNEIISTKGTRREKEFWWSKIWMFHFVEHH